MGSNRDIRIGEGRETYGGGWIVYETLGMIGTKRIAGPFSSKEEAKQAKAIILDNDIESYDEYLEFIGISSPRESNKVIPIKLCSDAALTLRNIADQIDNGELPNEATVICGFEVFHAGQVDDGRAATDAVFNLTVGIHKLMKPVVEAE